MLLQDHLLRLHGPGHQLRKFIREFRLGREDRCTVGCDMADVDLVFLVLVMIKRFDSSFLFPP